MEEWIDGNIATINGVVLFLTLLVIIWYSWETRKARLSNERYISLLERQTRREIERERTKNNLSRSYILSQIDVLIAAVKHQVKYIEVFLIEFRKQNTIGIIPNTSPDFNTQRIRVIPLPEIYDVFVVGKNGENNLQSFNLLLSQLDLIDRISDLLSSSSNYIIEHFSKYEENFNVGLDKISELYHKWSTGLMSLNVDLMADPFLKEFFNIFNQWASKENLDMFIVEESFIKPLLEKARETQPSMYALDVLPSINGCLNAMDNIRNLKSIKIAEYENYIEQLNAVSTNLSKIKGVFTANEVQFTQD